jgi:hypothetical protein
VAKACRQSKELGLDPLSASISGAAMMPACQAFSIQYKRIDICTQKPSSWSTG